VNAGAAERGRARAALALSRFAEAAAHAARAIGENPGAVDGYGLLGQAEIGLGKPANALATAERGLGVSADSEWLHRLRSIALRQLSKHKQAVAAANEAVRLAPDVPQAHYVLAQAFAATGRRKEALAEAERTRELDPSNALYVTLLGDLYLKKKPKLAEEYYRQSLALDPESAATLNNLGVSLLRQRRTVDAAAAFKSAVLLDPTLAVARRNAHSTLDAMLRGGGVLGLVIGLQAVLRGFSILNGPTGLWLGAVLIGTTVVVWFLFRKWRTASNRKKLARADPQLLSIYEKLRADKKTGHL
jgi:tetratricopeptide (TPR) repeat protein